MRKIYLYKTGERQRKERRMVSSGFRLLLIIFCILTGSKMVYSQNLSVEGTVVSMADSNPLANITVKVLGEDIPPVTTDSLGNFVIEVTRPGVLLEASYSGFKTQTLYWDGESRAVLFRMVDEGDYWIEDEISAPYGKIKDKDFTGARSYLGESLLTLENHSGFDSGIKGVAPGVRNISYSGAPGSGSALMVRGISSISGGTQPLIVLDGLVLRNHQFENPLTVGAYNSPLSDINPNDIKSITIIKDGASASFYGVRAANGVVLIETNKGTTGKTSLSVDLYSGISVLANRYPLLDRSEYKSYFKDLNYMAGVSPMEFAQTYGTYFYEDITSDNYYRFRNNTDWQKEVTQLAQQQNFYLNLKGGDQVTTYAFSTGYLKEEGVVRGSDFMRFTIDFNLIYRISEKVRFGNVVNYNFARKNQMDEGINPFSNPLFLSLIKSPITAPFIYSREGIKLDIHEDQDFFNESNPAHIVTDLKNVNDVNRMLGNLYLDFDFSQRLGARISMGIDYNRQNERRFYPDYGLVSSSNAIRYAESKINNQFMMQVDGYLTYNKILSGNSRIDLLAGGSFQNTQLNYTYGKSINSAADYFTTLSTGDADSIASNDHASKLASLFLKANYSIKNKYLFAANGRVDGSSRFGENNRFGMFYGISGAWRLAEEPFLREVRNINELKLKAGFGITGNENIDDFAAYNMYGGSAYNLRGATKPISLGNADLRWEQTSHYDAGIQFLGYNARLGVDLDLYLKQTKDLFYVKELPSITGYSGILSNLGTIRNAGADLGLFIRILDKRLRWDSRINVGTYKNEVVSLNENISSSYHGFTGIAKEGEAVGSFWGYRMIGIFDTDEEASQVQNGSEYEPFRAGDIKFHDLHPDGTINEKDLQVIGSPHPDLFGGFLNSFEYGRWALDLNLTYSLGNDAMNVTRSRVEGMYNHYNQTVGVLRAWRKQGDANHTNVPRIALNDPAGNARNSSRWVEDASYLRIQSVGIAYNMSEDLLKRIFIQSAKIYLKGQNLYTFTNYLGFDPEFITGSNALGYGIDQGAYPMPRTVILGVKIGL